MKKAWLIALVIILALAGWSVSAYNGLVSMNEQVKSSWAQVDTQLQRRADLIPNLVNTVKGYAVHEQDAVQAVSDARAKLRGSVLCRGQDGRPMISLSSALGTASYVFLENLP